MCNFKAALAASFLVLGVYSSSLFAQESAPSATTSEVATPAEHDSGSVRFARYRQYPWNGVNVWVGNAYETRSASHNQHFDGSMRILGIQLSRDIWRGKSTSLSYIGEVLPVMLVHSGPPLSRMPDTLHTPSGYYSPAELNRFKYRSAYGFGIAPFGLEYTYPMSRQLSAVVNMTAGALVFTKVVPYGRGTQPNFTVSPGVALQWAPQNRARVAFGYTFHHLSNASFGDANPGMNSQLLYVRFSRLRAQAVKP